MVLTHEILMRKVNDMEQNRIAHKLNSGFNITVILIQRFSFKQLFE